MGLRKRKQGGIEKENSGEDLTALIVLSILYWQENSLKSREKKREGES